MKVYRPLKSREWNDLVKKKLQLKTDMQLAEVLRVKKQTISHQRLDQHSMREPQAFLIADILGVSIAFPILSALFEKCDDSEMKKRIIDTILQLGGDKFIVISHGES